MGVAASKFTGSTDAGINGELFISDSISANNVRRVN